MKSSPTAMAYLISLELCEKMILRACVQKAKEKAAQVKKKASKDELIANVAVVKAKLQSNNNKLQSLNIAELKLLAYKES